MEHHHHGVPGPGGGNHCGRLQSHCARLRVQPRPAVAGRRITGANEVQPVNGELGEESCSIIARVELCRPRFRFAESLCRRLEQTGASDHRLRRGISVLTSSALSAQPGTAPAVTEQVPPTVDPRPCREQESLRVGSGMGDGDCSRAQDRHRSPTIRSRAPRWAVNASIATAVSAFASTTSDRASSPTSVLREAIPVAPMPMPRIESTGVRAMLPWPRRRAVGSAVGRCCRPLRWRLRDR